MQSRLSDQARRELLDLARRMTPARRLKAFAELCRLVHQLAEAGRRHRASPAR